MGKATNPGGLVGHLPDRSVVSRSDRDSTQTCGVESLGQGMFGRSASGHGRVVPAGQRDPPTFVPLVCTLKSSLLLVFLFYFILFLFYLFIIFWLSTSSNTQISAKNGAFGAVEYPNFG